MGTETTRSARTPYSFHLPSRALSFLSRSNYSSRVGRPRAAATLRKSSLFFRFLSDRLPRTTPNRPEHARRPYFAVHQVRSLAFRLPGPSLARASCSFIPAQASLTHRAVSAQSRHSVGAVFLW
eukprot:1041925-Prymnesium_polylepis.1